LAEKPEAHAATEQKNPDQDAYDCQLPNAGKLLSPSIIALACQQAERAINFSSELLPGWTLVGWGRCPSVGGEDGRFSGSGSLGEVSFHTVQGLPH
jgi:hypothetical protein